MALLAGMFVLPGAIHAQPDPATVQAVPPPPPPPPPPPAECTPSCRSGYVCLAGQCVSNCNPPCPPGDQCRNGECVASQPQAQAQAPAQQEAADPGAERHDGLMLRLTTGIGYSAAGPTEEHESVAYALGGFSGSFSFDLGGELTENLVLHARFSDLPMFDPTVYLDGDEVAEINDGSLTAVMVAPALTLYFMPVNMYLTLALGFSWLVYDTERTESRSSQVGFGSNFDVGKEWWVSDNWGLGIAARFWYTHVSIEVSDDDVPYNMLGFGILFSATYN